MGNFMKQTNKKRRLFEDEMFGSSEPLPLNAIDKKAAQAAWAKKGGELDGDTGDDKLPVSKYSGAAVKLKPSQKEVVPKKATEFAFCALLKVNPMAAGPGGDLQAIVSSDLHIMDGHHRWAATILVDPSATIDAVKIDIPGEALVTALNVVTAGKGRKGNTGEGNISNFGGKPIEDEIDIILEKGFWGGDAEKCKAAFEAWGGSVEEGKKKMVDNAKKMIKSIPGWAPSRVNMPVIQAPEVKAVSAALAAGSVDIKPPYSPEVEKRLNPSGAKSESIMRAMESYYQMRTGQKKLTETTLKILRDYNKKNQTRLHESYLKKVRKQKLQEKLSDLLKPLVEQSLKSILRKKLK
jgi:hypothetical protein